MRLRLPLLSALTLCLAACSRAPGGGQHPNVLLITLDTTRSDHLDLGQVGAGRSPNLAAIAAEGVWCSNAVSASALTPVSHASILTGEFPYHHGLRVLYAGSGYRLPEDRPTLATAFKAAGYHTGAVHSAFPVSGFFGFDRDFDHFDSFDGAIEKREDGFSGWDVQDLQRRSDETTARALTYLRSTEGPWFLWIHYWDPHDGALVPPREFLAQSAIAGQAHPKVDDLYTVEVEYLDREIGELVTGLRAAGLWEKTLVAITADHGEGLSDGMRRHGWSFHRVLYQEQVHVPLILRGPTIPKGGRVDALVRTVDIAPTLLDYSGVPGPRSDGRSLRPLLEGRADSSRIAYADQVNAYDRNSRVAQRRPKAAFLNSIIDWPWKLIWRPHMPGSSELFNLEEDPEERTNRITEHAEIVQRLLADLIERDPWVTAPFPDQGAGRAGVSSALGALGYGGADEGEAPPAGPVWHYTCQRHPDLREAAPGRCPRCGRPLFPIGDG